MHQVGFKGSGQYFHRRIGEVIHAVTVQPDKWGDGCSARLGVDLAFLPDSEGLARNPAKLREIDCMLRGSLDGFWEYGHDSALAAASARAMIEAYFREGEEFYARFRDTADVLRHLEPVAFGHARGSTDYGITESRAALMGARIHRHLDNLAEMRRFAEAGLRRIGTGPAGLGLVPELQTLANS